MIDSFTKNAWETEKVDEAKEAADKIKKTPLPYLARVVSGFSGGLLLLLFLYLYKDGKLTRSFDANKEELIDWSLFWFGLAFMVWSWPTKTQLEGYGGWLSSNSLAIGLFRSFLNSIFFLFAYRDLEVKLIDFQRWSNRKTFNWFVSFFSSIIILLFFIVPMYTPAEQTQHEWLEIFDNILFTFLLLLYTWTFAIGIPRRRIVSYRIVAYFIGILSSSGFLVAFFYYMLFKFELFGDFDIQAYEAVKYVLVAYYQFSIIISIVFLSFSWSYERERQSTKKLSEALEENKEQQKKLEQALNEKNKELKKRKIAEDEKKQAMENEINAKKDALHLFKNALRRIRGLMVKRINGLTEQNTPLEPYQYVASSVDSLLYFVEGEFELSDGASFNQYIESVLGKLQDLYRLEHFDYSQALLEKDQYCSPNLLQKFGQVIVEIVQNAYKHGNSSLVLSMELSEAKVMTIRAQDKGGELVYDVNKNSGMRIMRNYLRELDNKFDGNIRKEDSTIIIIFNFHKILQTQ